MVTISYPTETIEMKMERFNDMRIRRITHNLNDHYPLTGELETLIASLRATVRPGSFADTALTSALISYAAGDYSSARIHAEYARYLNVEVI
jgi:hypothetical protein